jgi:lipopolysaccharide export system protein LptA
MRVTIQGLRRWIVVAAALLLAVVAGFFFYGRNRFRHIERDLPGRLGVDIQQSANGFSYTQRSQGHALFTLKASKELQLKSGHVLLHDVDITLYGPPGSGRTDRIYGSDFDYDQNAQVVASQGDVNIELQGMGATTPATGAGSDASNNIRVRTRGLTFAQKTGEATTTQAVEFQLPRAAGTSVGADYNSKTGVIVLNSQVHITTSSNGKPAVIDAAHATLLRASDQAFLVNAALNYETEGGSADQAVVYFRKDGTTEKVDAKGHVRMKTDTGATVDCETGLIFLDAKSQPTQADLGGGVQFASTGDNDTMHGSASEGTLLFTTVNGGQGSQTALQHAEFRQDVSFEEQISGLAKDPHGHAEKQMHAQKVDVEFGPPRPGQSLEARKAFAEGSPVVTSRQIPSKGPQQTTSISGDHLVATLGEENTLRQLDGAGNTQVVQSATDGSRDTTKGDVLHATFVQEAEPAKGNAVQVAVTPAATRAEKGKKTDQGPKMQTTLDTAIQDGNVMLTETPTSHPIAPTAGAPGTPASHPVAPTAGAPGTPARTGATTQPATLTGWSQHAEYHAADQVLHLSGGNPRITDSATMQIAADFIDYHRDTQNAAASRNVKATYTEQQKSGAGPEGALPQSAPPPVGFGGGNGPVHVIAERATMDHAKNQDLFYGAAQAPARMWQDTDSLLAPVIEIDRDQNVLKARGEGPSAAPVVNANFTSAMGAKRQQSEVRVHSQTLVYSDKTRQGDFRGTVTAEQGDETIHADDALVFLKPAAANAKGNAVSSKQAEDGGKGAASPKAPANGEQQNSQVDHMIATGHVVFTQPGRKGDGEKLVYTADDGQYVLTGTAASPPKMWDRMHGTTTGEALIFNSQDDSVVVSGGKSSAVTETRAKK